MRTYEYTTVNWIAVLGIILVLLKLTGHIGLAWIWVLAPFWIPAIPLLFFFGIPFLAMAGFAIVYPIALLIDAYQNWRRRRRYEKRKNKLDKYR